ncbi:MAG TPA: STAS domain-containing protein [Actinophytocola sp.]|uniref:STAS domain-containing protein n=1 Tax=Actinophytocola sp. TaxID=1872138 RepID=UPI002DBEB3C4|nr:STAS domain-containing protein [Actinophytocola sp.]HEU5472446.1 STAS domain-containing protein [Actinophytocola sp.]
MDTGFGDDAAVIRPQGRLTMVSAPQLRSMVVKAVEDHRIRVVVDLSATEFMDSSGLGALIAGLKTTRQAGGDLRIACMGPQVATIIQLANLDRVLRPYPTVAEALQ